MLHQHIVVATNPPQSRLRYVAARFWPEALGVLFVLAITLSFLRTEPCPDVAWQLWVAHQLRYGARFYVDIIEPNPPLWFWMAIPVDWAAGVLDARPGVILVAATGFAAALSLVASGRLLAIMPASRRAALLAYGALALVLMPLADMAQREQFVLFAALPYALLVAARREQQPVPRLLALAIGTGSAFGFALKHYFLISPALLELWLAFGLRPAYRLIRPETAMLALMAAIYAASVLLVAPDYLRHMVPILRLAYRSTDAKGLLDMILPAQFFWIALTIAIMSSPRLAIRAAPAAALTIAAFGFALDWLIQFKGWAYHSIPTTGCLMMAAAVLALQHWKSLSPASWVTMPSVLTLPLIWSSWVGPYRDLLQPMTRPLLTGLSSHDSLAILSESANYAWPLSLRRSSVYPSRQYSLWIIGAVVNDQSRTPALMRLGRQVVRETAQDYRCTQPKRIVFDPDHRHGFDMRRYFSEDRAFADLMRHYHFVGRYGKFELFDRTAPFLRPPANECRRAV